MNYNSYEQPRDDLYERFIKEIFPCNSSKWGLTTKQQMNQN